MILNQQDGSITIKPGESWPVNMKSYRPHPTIPLTMIPNFPDECASRIFIGKVTACHRPVFQWRCLINNSNISIKDCKGCTYGQEERISAFTKSFYRGEDCNNCRQHESGQSTSPDGAVAVS